MFITKKSNDAINGICYITRAREEIVSPYVHLLNDACTIYIIYIIFNRGSWNPVNDKNIYRIYAISSHIIRIRNNLND